MINFQDHSDDLSDIEDGQGPSKEGESGGEDDMDEILNDPDFAHMSDSDGDDLPLFGDKVSIFGRFFDNFINFIKYYKLRATILYH
jgi:hypothetical protein